MSKLQKNGATAVIGILFFIAPFFAHGTTLSASGNLILNADMQSTTVASTTPDNWFQGGYGTTTATYNYPVPGPTSGDVGAEVTLSNYVSGAAEWYFKNVAVTGNNLYSFSDSYNSTIESYLIAQWTMNDGSLSYDAIATLPSTNGTWAHTPQEVFPAPSNAVSVTVLHLIQNTNGSLTTADYALTNYTPSNQGAFSKAMVSLTFDDGWTSQYNNARPILNAAHMPATYYIITDPILSATDASSGNLLENTGIATGTITASSTIHWGNITNVETYGAIFTDPTYQEYTFTDTYTSTTTSTLRLDYCSISQTGNCPAGDVVSMTLGSLPAGNNMDANFSFTLPTISGNTVTPISISQSPDQNGVITVSNPSLIEYQDYMTESQLQTLQAEGNEIDSHTETHPDLDLTTISDSTASQEISGSRSVLESFGMSPVDGIAYPFGDYNSNIKQMVSAAGYTNARTVDVGFNTATTDPLLLKSESAVASTTFSTIQSWIDTAIANKWWLVITFHDVDPANIIAQNGEVYGVTPQMLQEIVSYLQTKEQNNSVSIVTMDQGTNILHNISPITPPVSPIPVPAVTIVPTTLPSGTVGTAYNQTLTASTTATGSFTWSVSSGTLPAGLILNSSSALISGTPTADGTSTFNVLTTNGTSSTTQPYTINIAASGSTVPVVNSGNTGIGIPSSGGGYYAPPIPLGKVLGIATGPVCQPGDIYNIATDAPCPHISTSTPEVESSSIPVWIFSRNLMTGMFGRDVKLLQQYLNLHGFNVASAGRGSPGNETEYFGQATRAAVIKFQVAAGIKPASGYFGPISRSHILN